MEDPQRGDWKAQEPYNTGLASYQGDSNLQAAQDAWYFAASQYRCPYCNVPVYSGIDHAANCTWLAEQNQMRQNSTPNYEGLANAYRSVPAVDPPAVNIEPPKFFQF